jgi:hypothetical protein
VEVIKKKEEEATEADQLRETACGIGAFQRCPCRFVYVETNLCLSESQADKADTRVRKRQSLRTAILGLFPTPLFNDDALTDP